MVVAVGTWGMSGYLLGRHVKVNYMLKREFDAGKKG
jgi:hypothetical protein